MKRKKTIIVVIVIVLAVVAVVTFYVQKANRDAAANLAAQSNDLGLFTTDKLGFSVLMPVGYEMGSLPIATAAMFRSTDKDFTSKGVYTFSLQDKSVSQSFAMFTSIASSTVGEVSFNVAKGGMAQKIDHSVFGKPVVTKVYVLPSSGGKSLVAMYSSPVSASDEALSDRILGSLSIIPISVTPTPTASE